MGKAAGGEGACLPADKTEFDMGAFEKDAAGIIATYKCGGAAAGGAAGGDKAADEKACDALADASDDAKKACKTWAGKKCADETDEKKKECTAAKASATTLAASAVALFAVASLM